VLGNVCYQKSDGKLWKAKADSATTMPAYAIALGTISADATGSFDRMGYVNYSVWSFTPNTLLWVSETTAGLVTSTQPTGTGKQVQCIGQAVGVGTSSPVSIIDYNPSNVVVELS
jgi:hypothetical protein